MVSDEQLLSWNRRGLIAGPQESEEDFLHRIEVSLQGAPQEVPSPLIQEALAEVAELYDISPDWVPVFYSNRGLGLWHGGGTVLDLVDGALVPSIQLRSALQSKGRYLGIYRIEEFLAHEFVHTGRVAFQEHRFEETLAYQTSRSRFRRLLGPVVRSGGEAWLFVVVLLISVSLDYFFYALGYLEVSLWIVWIYLLPAGLFVYGMWRLFHARNTLKRCRRRLALLTDDQKARYILYRLTDQEVRRFSRSTEQGIRAYIEKQTSLRWRMIKKAYFSIAA